MIDAEEQDFYEKAADLWTQYEKADEEILELAEEGIGIVIEVKYAEEKQLEAACTEALAQIARMDYDARLRQDGMDTIIRYGIGCCRKKCKVVVQG